MPQIRRINESDAEKWMNEEKTEYCIREIISAKYLFCLHELKWDAGMKVGIYIK